MKLSDPAVVCVVSCCVVLRVGWIAVTWNPNYKCWVWYVWMMVEDDGFCFGLNMSSCNRSRHHRHLLRRRRLG